MMILCELIRVGKSEFSGLCESSCSALGKHLCSWQPSVIILSGNMNC
jgi:hypothetical protein